MINKSLNLRIDFLIHVLIGLIFISKCSTVSLLPLPREFSFLVFQHGMHPYLNIAATMLFGIPLLFFWSICRTHYQSHFAYKFFISVLIFLLFLQTTLQVLFVNVDESLVMQAGAVIMSSFLVLTYGLAIPSLWGPIKILKCLQKWSASFVVISVILLLFARPGLYKGGRFVGIFKHIPHMVTCSTLSFVLTLAFLFEKKKAKYLFRDLFVLLCSFFPILITGTRSSVAAAVGAMGMTLFFYKFISRQAKLIKFLALLFVFTFLMFFGYDSFRYAQDVATGTRLWLEGKPKMVLTQDLRKLSEAVKYLRSSPG